ncbi:hypothetical protein BOX15_Mlig021574g2 [Macrostomum lignano]|uniref:Cadherin domain-containing protein n=2 Tax=Macrostomum lignano TaxID=282301 RepID=A0A267GUM8_9PLAT|nr:hypothetical protein BOX15_Mlig021574g2 [Macrostomum lignano]
MKQTGTVAALLQLLLLLLMQHPGIWAAESPDRYNFTVHENRPAGFQVGQVKMSSGFAYQLSPDSPLFSFDPGTGIVTTKSLVDREALSSDVIDLLVIGTSASSVQTISVRVNVLDENDNSPRFPDATVGWDLSENSAVGSGRLLPLATDPDAGANSVTLNYKIVAGNEAGKFHLRVESSLGFPQLNLITVARLDRETAASYSLNISAEDGGNPARHGYLAVSVTVLDYNDNPPVFEAASVTAVVNESTPVGSVLARVRATDADQPGSPNSQVSYRVKVGPAGGQFALDAVSGVLTLARPLDCFRTSDGCSVTVEAADAGTPQLMSEPDCLITISVQLANSNPPEIRVILTTQKDGFAIIDETSKPGDALAIVQVTDADVGLNGETSLALLNSSGYFALASLTSLYYQIVTAKAFDAESPKQFALLLLAQDKGNPPLTSTLAVRVQVNRANQFAPEFDQPLIDTKLSEAAPVGSLVATLVARDNDSAGLNSQVQYQIVEGNVDGAFGLVPDTGLLVTRQPLSLASRPAYRLNISASDMGPKRLVSYALVTVGLQGVNHPPACNASHLSYAARPWGSALTVPLAALCADADQDRNGSLTFSVRRRRPPTDTQCSVTTSSGGLQQLDCPSLTASAQYAIRVADNADKPLFADLTIEIEVSRPLSARPKLYPALYLAAVPAGEQWFGAELARIRAPNSGTNATFAFDSGSTVGFAIDSADGTVRLAGYAADAPVEFSVSVTDSRGAKASSPATVRVFPVPAGAVRPSFGQKSYEFTAAEAASASSRTIGAVAASPSAAGAFYVIADGDPAGLFSISPAGVISLTGSLDREATPQFNLTVAFVTSSDFCTVAVRILVADINDNSPAFEWSAYDFAVNESSTPLGHVIGVLTATDPDLGLNGRVTLELASNPGRYFSLDSSAGLLYLARPVPLWKAADLASGGVTLTVRASDAGSPSRSAEATVRVSVSVTPPPWPKLARSTFSFALFENASVNSEFGRVALAVGASEAVEFALSPEFAPLSLTDTQQRIGLLPSGGLYVARPLDRETRDTFELPVFARFVGAGPAAGLATASVVVHVGDINDCAPVFGGSGAAGFVFQLAENRTAGQPVGRVFAADADAGPNGQVQYWLAGTADFAVDPLSGQLRALRTFDRELPTERQFLFTVVAADGGEPTLTSTAAVRVVIADVNDCEPRFSSAWLNVSVAEDAAEGAVVARLTANDEDAAGDNSAVSFAIVSGNELGHFALSEVTGELRVAKLLDYEAQNSFRLVVTAADRGSPPLISSATILLRVTNVNDHRPAFANATQPEASVSEAAAPGTVLYRFRASDEDAGDSERLVFSITAGNSGGDIGMDASTGRLYVANALDFETRSSYSLTVRVADAGGLAAKTAFVVRVLNVNDNPPTFKQAAPLVLHAPENLTAPALLGRVVATDADIGDSISYRLVFQEPFGDEFAVDARSGEIRAVHSLDRERVAVYKLHLAALDSPVSAQLTSTATVVTVIVDDVDDNQPILLTPPVVLLPQTLSPGSRVCRLFATDADEGDNALISFGLAGSDASMFAVDRSTGVVTLLADPAAASTGRAFYNLSVLLAGAEPQPLLLIGQSQDGSGPVFTQTAYWAQVAEGLAEGQEILQVRAQQQGGSGGSGGIRYFISGIFAGNQSRPQSRGLFQLDPVSGSLRAGPQPLDREATPVGQYQVEITAADLSATGASTGTAYAYVTLTDANDTPPTFPTSVLDAVVSEDAQPPVPLVLLAAADPDSAASQTLSYSLVEEAGEAQPSSEISVDASTGLVRLTRMPNTSQLSVGGRQRQLQLQVTDGRFSSRCLLRLAFSRSLQRPPVFAEVPGGAFNMSEAAPADSLVGAVRVQPPDSRLRLASPQLGLPFSLHPASGLLLTTGPLDYEARSHYLLVLVATDTVSGLAATASVAVNILDVNDSPPTCSAVAEVALSAAEASAAVAADSPILRGAAADADEDGAAPVSLRLAWGSPESLPLRLNSVTGELHLTGPPQPDGASWRFDVEASDGVHTAACRVSVAVAAAPTRTDTPPNSTAEVTVAENSPPGEIFAWQCRFHGNSTPIQYTLAGDIGSSFGLVEKTSGRLRLLKALDREAAAAHSLRLSCACSRPSGPAAATLDLSVLVADENDNSPTFAASSASAVTIARNLPADAPVAQLTATDPDAGENGTVAFLLLSHTETFYVDSATGQVRLRSAASDLQGAAGFEVWAEARDRGRLWRSARRLLNVSLAAADICAPVFQQPDFTFWVEEALPSSQLPAFVGRAAATDCDSPALLYQSLDDSVPFSVTTDGGLVRATSAVDRESRPLPFVFTVQAFDNSSPRKSASATVSVSVADRNDNRPRCAWRLAFHRVAEDAPVGLEVGQLVATDSDLGKNARLEFGLVDGDGTFAINATNGRLTLRAPLDREQRAEHNLRVRVTDFGAPRLSADCRVRVSVADVNDNSPLSAAAGAFEFKVLATETRGALVGGVRAWDPDAGANGSVTYSLVAGGDSDSVQLDSADSSSGFIYLRRSLDGAAPGSLLSFTVDATDGGGRRTPLPVRLRVLAAPAAAALAVAGFANHPAVISVVEGLAEPGRPLANLTAVTGRRWPRAPCATSCWRCPARCPARATSSPVCSTPTCR